MEWKYNFLLFGSWQWQHQRLAFPHRFDMSSVLYIWCLAEQMLPCRMSSSASQGGNFLCTTAASCGNNPASDKTASGGWHNVANHSRPAASVKSTMWICLFLAIEGSSSTTDSCALFYGKQQKKKQKSVDGLAVISYFHTACVKWLHGALKGTETKGWN